MIVIGLMSGTSADGIDAAVVEITGAPPHLNWQLLYHTTIPHPAALRAEILACCDPRSATVDRICVLNAALGQAFGSAALTTATACGLSAQQIDLIGSHGQTIWHAPNSQPASTLQIGTAAEISELTGVPVISDFRTRDIAAGGQGAPLVPAVDVLLLSHPTFIRAAQNIGGIGNMTYLPPGGIGALAFDTGPGNMLIDSAMRKISGGREAFDRNGAFAAQGHVHGTLLEELLDHPFLQRKPPKSTGREDFGAAFSEQIHARAHILGLSEADLMATLTAFSADSIANAYRSFLPHMPAEVIVSGGGARNATLMHMLGTLLAPARLLTSDAIGIPAEAKEALAFAVLAYETWHGRPGNLPAATGAARPVILGSVTGRQGDRETGRQGDAVTGEHDNTEIGQARSNAPMLQCSNAPMLHPEGTRLQRSIAPSLPLTETRNPASTYIDTVSTIEMLQIINYEDAHVAAVVQAELPQIAMAVEAIAERMRIGGRLIYVGAGTSGRLGALDAAECPPTYNTPPELVIALIAGGKQAFDAAIEGAEDDASAGASAVQAIQITPNDVLIGIAASGNTPYVIGAMQAARATGAQTISLACSHPSAIANHAYIVIAPLVGPEVITGSTRMKAGTAQKMVLNMITTAVMIRLGKTYGNLMVDVQSTNTKLRQRALRIVCEATGLEEAEATILLAACQHQVKTAIVAALGNITPAEAQHRLNRAGGRVREALR